MTIAFTVAGICLLAIYSVYFLLNRRITGILNSKQILSTVDEEINGLILEMNQTTERNILLLEDRIKTLTELMAVADKTVIRLNRELDRHKSDPEDYSHLAKLRKIPVQINEKVREGEKLDENLSDKDKILDMYKRGLSPGLIASKTGTSIGEVELIITLNSRKG